MPSSLPKLRYATLTDVGRQRLANEDAVAADTRLGLFVVCDGVGGRPSGEAASQIVSHTLPHLMRRRLRRETSLDEARIESLLYDSVVAMNQQMHAHSQPVPALNGMGCTLVAALFDSRTVFQVHTGDSRLYLLRSGELFPLTEDHTNTRQKVVSKATIWEPAEVSERRLLMQYIGAPEAVSPGVSHTALQRGDRLLLCSDGLTDPVPDSAIAELLRREADPSRAASALVAAANEAGGPDNITVAVVDYLGVRRLTDADRRRPRRTPADVPAGVAEQVHAALRNLEQDLFWLKQGAAETAVPSRLSSLAAAKRRLGEDAFRQFLSHHPGHSPSHVFHQFCTRPDSAWRRRYSQHMSELEPPLSRLTGGSIRLSPVLTSDETAQIYKDLWSGWRRVEHRYFATCQRSAITATDQTLNILIDHMVHSVVTLGGLLQFLPRFMRPTAASRSA